MTDDQEPSEDKLSKLKLKLKSMGVMQDENATPEHKSKPFWRGKLPILLVVIFAIGFIWWISNNELTETDTLAGNTAPHSSAVPSTGSAYSPPAGQQANPYHQQGPSTWNQTPQNNNANSGAMRPGPGPNWPGNTNRYYDRYGPPPGWQPYRGYRRPPPPPPRFYGYPYYGSPPGFYRNDIYRGYNGPWSPPK